MKDRVVDAALTACMMAMFTIMVAMIGVKLALITGAIITTIGGVIVGHDGKIDWMSILGDVIGITIGLSIHDEYFGIF